jgi:hypothetical protein
MLIDGVEVESAPDPRQSSVQNAVRAPFPRAAWRGAAQAVHERGRALAAATPAATDFVFRGAGEREQRGVGVA